MTGLAWKAWLIVPLLLLSATIAHAECAWVMWVDKLSSTSAPETTPVRAYNTRSECDDGLTAAVDSFVGGPVVLKRRQEVHVTGNKSTTIYRYVCLPDTIDPRGPGARPEGRLTA